MVSEDSHYITEIDELLTIHGLLLLFERNRGVKPRQRVPEMPSKQKSPLN